MKVSRRDLFRATAVAFVPPELFGAPTGTAPKIGVTDWNLKKAGDLEAVPLAKSLGFDGVQVSLGRTPVDGKLPLANAEIQTQYVARGKQQSISLA